MRRLYLAGPMSGLPDLNYPAFNAEAERLRALGYDVVNPAEINGTDMSWAACMKRDIAELLTCDGIALLQGWERSKGASVEHHVASALGMGVVMADTLTEPAERVAA